MTKDLKLTKWFNFFFKLFFAVHLLGLMLKVIKEQKKMINWPDPSNQWPCVQVWIRPKSSEWKCRVAESRWALPPTAASDVCNQVVNAVQSHRCKLWVREGPWSASGLLLLVWTGSRSLVCHCWYGVSALQQRQSLLVEHKRGDNTH